VIVRDLFPERTRSFEGRCRAEAMNAKQAARILILDGHPDPDEARFIHALAASYAQGALAAGHEVRHVRLASLDFPLLRSNKSFLHEQPPPTVQAAQKELQWCSHLVVLYPLWLGAMPALLKGFFEQALRPGFAFEQGGKGLPKKLLAGRSVRIVITMGMPSFFYRFYFRAHSLKSLERNILRFTGFAPIRSTIIGSIETGDANKRTRWLARIQELGRTAK
jgi:putative NADPH-quinone reductase